nr:protein FAR1-RELATED SEQUENCE 5-like [Ipomoea trifida]
MFSQIIKEHKDMLLSDPGCCSSVADKRSIIEAVCGSSVPSEVSVLPPKKAKNKGSGKRIKGFKEIAIEETGVVSSSVVVCCVRFGVVSVEGPVGVVNSSLITFCFGLFAADFFAVRWTRLITLSTSSGVIPKLKLGPSAILALYCSLLAIALSISSKAAMNSGGCGGPSMYPYPKPPELISFFSLWFSSFVVHPMIAGNFLVLFSILIFPRGNPSVRATSSSVMCSSLPSWTRREQLRASKLLSSHHASFPVGKGLPLLIVMDPADGCALSPSSPRLTSGSDPLGGCSLSSKSSSGAL